MIFFLQQYIKIIQISIQSNSNSNPNINSNPNYNSNSNVNSTKKFQKNDKYLFTINLLIKIKKQNIENIISIQV